MYRVLMRAASLMERGAKGLLYLAAGTLRVAEFRDRAMAEYETYRVRDDEILQGLLWWERDIYDRFLRPGDRILIVGVGTGRDLIALMTAGHEVVGLDCLEYPLQVARRQVDALGQTAELVHGAIEERVALPGTFDVVIFSNNTYTAIPQSSRRVSALTYVRQHLRPGGRIIAGYFATETEQSQHGIRLSHLTSWLTRSDWRLEPHDVVSALGPRGELLHYHHLFTTAEFEREARTAGLNVMYHRLDPPTAVLTL